MVRRILEHHGEYESRWAAICSIAGKLDCAARTWASGVRRTECNSGQELGAVGSEQDRLEELKGENRELKRANEILHKAAAFSLK